MNLELNDLTKEDLGIFADSSISERLYQLERFFEANSNQSCLCVEGIHTLHKKYFKEDVIKYIEEAIKEFNICVYILNEIYTKTGYTQDTWYTLELMDIEED